MNKIEQPKRRSSMMLITTLITFTLVLFGQATTAMAQATNTFPSSGNVGVGTTTPAVPLHVLGDNDYTSATNLINSQLRISGATDPNMRLLMGYNTASNFGYVQAAQVGTAFRNLSLNPLGGNVGIGTTNPGARLDIIGNNIPFGGQLRLAASDYAQITFFKSNNLALNDTGRKAAIFYNMYTSQLVMMNTNGGSYDGPVLLNPDGGSIGIGTYSPSYKLDVQGGQINASGGLCIAGDCKTSWSQVGGGGGGGGTITGVTAGSGLTGGGTSGTVTLTNNDPGSSQSIFKNIANAAGTTQFSASSNNDALRFEGTGGTSITFNAASKKVIINSSTSGSTISAANVSAGQFGQNTGGGNYSFPANVDISGTLTWGNANSRTDGKNDAGTMASKSGFFETTAPVNYPAGASGWWHLIEARHSNDSNNYALQIAGSFFDQNLYMRKTNGNGTTAWSKFILQDSSNNVSLPGVGVWDSNGNVGIGTTAPTKKLDVNGDTNVNGNLTVTGNITAKYQDVAEWVPSRHKLAAGTVVVLDPEQSNHVMASASAYDTRVAGVVSATPGVILGESGEGKVMVATTGRVKIKVDASQAAIHVGDLLVTSDKEGVAMKSEPLSLGGTPIHRPGTLIGKALEPLEKGTGEILVLLSLQ